MTVRAADWSNYTEGELSQSGLQALKDAGFGLIIPQAISPPAGYPPGKTEAQCDAAISFGFLLDIYLWLWFGIADPLGDLARKLDLVARFQPQVCRLWVDVEDNTVPNVDAGGDPARYLDLIAQALELLDSFGAQLPTGIYSGLWYWFAWLQNSWRFQTRAVWPAEYTGNMNDPMQFSWFGGWSYANLLQSIGTSSIGPVSNIDQSLVSEVELNAMMGDVQPPAPPPSDINPLVVPFADLADRVVTDTLKAELARRTRSGLPAAPRRKTLQSVVDQTIAARTAALGQRPSAQIMRMLQSRHAARADRRSEYRPAA